MSKDDVICYPYKSGGSKWEDNELRHSLRSIERYWEGNPRIVLLGENPPEWLQNVEHVEAGDYKDALTKASQLDCERLVWMNDDILLLKPTKLQDLLPARVVGRTSQDKIEGWIDRTNPWWKSFGKLCRWLVDNGHPMRNYSSHTPYVYETKKIRELLEKCEWHGNKFPFETAYYNVFHPKEGERRREKWRPNDKTSVPDMVKTRFLNLTDRAVGKDLSPLRFWVMGCFKDKSQYEK